MGCLYFHVKELEIWRGPVPKVVHEQLVPYEEPPEGYHRDDWSTLQDYLDSLPANRRMVFDRASGGFRCDADAQRFASFVDSGVDRMWASDWYVEGWLFRECSRP